MNLENRLGRVRQSLKTRGCHSLLVTEAKNRQYLSGFDGSAGWLVVTPEKNVLITDGRYWAQVEKKCPQVELFRFVPAEHTDLAGALVALCASHQILTLGLETDGISLSVFRKIKKQLDETQIPLMEVEGMVAGFRECKDESEIEHLARAASIADSALGKALVNFKPGARECDLKAEIEYHILRLGGTSTSFSTIVASGPNGSLPHAGASDRVVKERELITIDFGAVFEGYCSDMTRTIWYGTLPEREKRILGAIRVAQAKAVEAVAAGVQAAHLDSIARDHLESAGLAEYFIHSLGHGVGLDIHEAPGLRKSSDRVLKLGQVITIEPGVYLSGETGCRVEDTVVVEAESCRVLNAFPKQDLGSTEPRW